MALRLALVSGVVVYQFYLGKVMVIENHPLSRVREHEESPPD